MKQRFQRLGVLLLALALSISLSVPALAAETSVDGTAASAAGDAMIFGGATQIGWAVWRDGEIISSGSQRPKRDKGAFPEGVGDAYGAGSISKIFTTVAVMQLAEAGKLDLDQPVVKYLPNFKMADPRYRDITVRMLLNHSSGLMGSSLGSGVLFDDASGVATGELLDRLSTQRLKAAPGAYSVYCNDGFTLAELVVEAVTDINFQDYLHANIFDPAGLKETWCPDEDFEDRRVDIYQTGGDRPLPKECVGIVGACGLYGTPEDIAAFGGALTDETLLKKSSLEAMARPEYARGLWPDEAYPNSMAFGLGWDNVEWYPFEQNGITALVKGGDTKYYHAGLVVIPEYKLSAAVLSAGGTSAYNEMAASQMLIAALREEGVNVSELRFKLPAAEEDDMPEQLLDNAGYYGSRTLYKIEIAGDGALVMRRPGMPEQEYHYYSDGTFRNAAEDSAIRFVKEKNGQTYLYRWAFSDLSGLGGLPTSNYAAMKLPENQVSQELQNKWNERMDRPVVPMNERYSSQEYLTAGSLLRAAGDGETENPPGYIDTLKIVDETHLRCVAQVPGMAGRDGSDIEVRQDAKGNTWFCYSSGEVCMDAAGVPALSTGKSGSAVCTIQPEGWARWYKVGPAAAGKTMTVNMPEDAGFWVYDGKGNVTASSVLWGDKTAKLADGGLIVFAGDPGARFELSFQ